jgi:CTP synthase (UTP-ammonia lyase)
MARSAAARGDRARLALVGDRSDRQAAHGRLDALIPHLNVQVDWVPSTSVTAEIAEYDGIWVIPGSPYADKEAVLLAIRLARETGIPYLGTCGGFQHALMEYGQSVLGFADADDVQYDPDARTPFIVPLECSLAGEQASLYLAEDSGLAAIYGNVESTTETYHCKYGLNPDYVDTFMHSALRICAWDSEKAPRAVELPGHPFFVGTLYQPELSSTPGNVHPLIEAFLAAVTLRAQTAAAEY